MNVDLMRAIDHKVGVPLTFILTIIAFFKNLIVAERVCAPKRLLFIELSEMGSTILADPAMRKAQEQLGCTLFFVIFSKNRASLDLIGTVDKENTFTIREDNIFVLAKDTIHFLFWSRKHRIDTVIDLELFSRFTALLTGLCGAVNRVGFYKFHNEGLYRGELLTHKVAYNPHIHIAKNFIALVNSLLSTQKELPYSKQKITDDEIILPVMKYSDEQLANMHAQVQKTFPTYQQDKNRIVLINPNASELLPQRRWDSNRYQELIKKILQTSDDIVILITGSPSERVEADDMCKKIADKRCVNFSGRLQLGELPILYSIATLMVTNDSGPGHFSSISKMPTFVLFGPETPKLYGSLGNATPIYAGLACSPCVSASNHRKTPCTDNKCLQVISVDQVLKALVPVLTIQDNEHL